MRDEFGRFVKGHSVPNEWVESSRLKNLGNNNHSMPHSEETKKLISDTHIRKGTFVKEKNPNWKGGLSSKSTQYRGSAEYKHWRQEVFKRDNFTCQKCNNSKEYLHAHHLKPFSEEMDNYDVSNGLTVCYKCHEAIHGFKLGKGSYIKK